MSDAARADADVMARCQQIQQAIVQEQDVLAQQLAEQWLREQPDHPMALVMMGHVLRVQKHHKALVSLGLKLMAISPQSADPMLVHGLADALYRTGKLDQALLYFTQALERVKAAPDSASWCADICCDLALAYEGLGAFEQSEQWYKAALAYQPNHGEAQYLIGLLEIKCSNLTRGFEAYRKRALLQEAPVRFGHACPRWQGESLAGKRLVVWSEQGIGDIAMFAGFIPYLLTQLSHLTIEIVPYMAPIMARSFPEVEVIAETGAEASQAVKDGQFDYGAPMGDLLPLLAHYQPRVVQGYLKPDANRVAELRARYRALSGRPVVGISWRTIHPDSLFRRNIPLALWAPILQVPEVQFVSLQYSGEQEELAYVKRTLGVDIHLDETVEPMVNRDDFFAQVAAMDAVVSIQNSTVHAGGAMGVPTLLMLSRAGDFRWGASVPDSVWYPTVEIIRQRDYGDWQPVLEQAGQWLQQHVHSS